MTDDSNQEQPSFKRRQVLSGVGGTVAAGSATSLIGGSGGGEDSNALVDRLAGEADNVQTDRDRRELAYLVDEMQSDAVYARQGFEHLSAAKAQEFAAKGQRLSSLLGECGYEGYEVDGGQADRCCAAHDDCEGENNYPDHPFNGDSCDVEFWTCVAVEVVTEN